MPAEWAQAGCACGAKNKAMLLFIDDGRPRRFDVQCAKCGQVMIDGRCVDQPGLLDRVKLEKVKPATARAATNTGG